ncbi:MAG: hypothetical protein U1E14_00815 [Geminicoccaceae bacterium]
MAAVIVTPEFINLEHPAILHAILLHLVENADVIGHDRRGLPVLRFEFVAHPWLLDKLAALGAAEEDFEDDDPAEDCKSA